MKNLLLLITILLAFGQPVCAQEKQTAFQTVKSAKGLMVFYRNPPQAFAFLVSQGNLNGEPEGNNVQIMTDSGALSEPLVVYFFKKADFLDKKKMYDDVEVLSAYRERNIATLEKVFKAKVNLDVDSKGFVKVYNLTDNIFPTKLLPTFYWSYVAPTPKNTDRTIFQAVVVGDLVLVLATVFNESIKLERVREFFTQTLESLTLLPPQNTETAPKKKPLKSKRKKN